MNMFFDYSYNFTPGVGFSCFSLGHFVWLAAGFLFIGTLAHFYKVHIKERRLTAFAVAALALSLELGRAALLLHLGLYDRGRLPLHLCTLSIYLCFFHSIHPSKTLGQFLYAFSLPGAVSALLFPDWADYPFWHFVTVSSFLLHFLMVLYPLMQVLTGGIKPDAKQLPRVLLMMLCLAVPIYFLNLSLDTNYMYLNYPLEATPLMLFSSLGRPGYLVVYPLLVSLVWLILYALPAAIKRLKLKI
jgi:hypothetical integral membrane protein (TIGR02206 family)